MKSGKYRANKTFHDFPCCHRAWLHTGACQFLHGYCRSFEFRFSCDRLDDRGFVIDLSSLKKLEGWLRRQFDHCCLIATDDPHLAEFERLQELGVLALTLLETVSSEGIADYIFNQCVPQIETELSHDEVLVTRPEDRFSKPPKNSGVTKNIRVIMLDRVVVRESEKISASAGL